MGPDAGAGGTVTNGVVNTFAVLLECCSTAYRRQSLTCAPIRSTQWFAMESSARRPVFKLSTTGNDRSRFRRWSSPRRRRHLRRIRPEWDMRLLSTRTVSSVAAYVNGLENEILYAGAAPQLVAGAFQIDIRVPGNSLPSNMTPVMIVVSDSRGVIVGIQDAVTIAVP